MKVQYKNTYFDIMSFLFYHYPRDLPIQALAVFFVIACNWPIYRILRAIDPSIASDVFSIVSSIIFLFITMLVSLITFAIIVVTFSAMAFLPRLNKGILTEHKLILSDHSLVEETKFNRTEHSWEGILRVRQNRRYIFVYVSQYSAHVIPKRAFCNHHEAEMFYKNLYSLQRAASRS
ncbi:MAG: YcxB family protein [Cyanobacteria bacterium P01_C01_bin.70]